MASLLRYERHHQPVASRGLFLRRLGRNLLVVLIVIGLSLLAGMVGYRVFEDMDWIDGFSQSAMILGGMGPYGEPVTNAGKIFSGIFALYAGLLVVGTSGLILAPIFHRVLHSFHVPDEEDEKRAEKSERPARRH